MIQNIELLSPAGSKEAFYMAVANGADAIYLGGKEFSARANANNFDREEMKECVDFAHIRGVKVFVTMNILLSDEELPKALEYAKYLWLIGVDALIVQDVGFAKKVRELLPNFELHGSTQMSILDVDGARFLEEMGFSRVVVGREVELEEIEKIKRETSLEVEAFCHGALCVSVSGQCLMSSMIGGRSGNRGSCAQPCRKQYEIVDDEKNPIYERGYAISPRDLNTLQDVGKLLEAGVDSFKLEGRMKRPEYVATITRNYREALDGKPYNEKDVVQIFNRTFTKGTTFGDFSGNYISFDRPDNRGVVAGEIKKRMGKNALFLASLDLREGDVLEMEDNKGRKKVLPLSTNAKAGSTFVLELNFTPKIPSVFQRVISQELAEKSQKSLENLYHQIPLNGKISIRIGKKPSFSLMGKKKVMVTLDQVVEEAKKAPLPMEKIEENLRKFDRSYYYLDSLEWDVDENAFIPIKSINQLRREAIEKYEEENFPREEISLKFSQGKREKYPSRRPLLTVEVSSFEQLKRVPMEKVDRLELKYIEKEKETFDFLKDFKGKIYLSMPTYDGTKEYREYYKKQKDKIHGIVAQNLGQMDLEGEKVVGEGLNVFNSESFAFFAKENTEIMPSSECRESQYKEFYEGFGSCGEILFYGYQRVMTMKHCPMSLKKKCGNNRNCKVCSFRKGYFIQDQRKANFPLLRRSDFTEVYNMVPTYLGNDFESVMKYNPRALKLRFLLDEEPVEEIVEAVSSALEGTLEELSEKIREYGFTRGHWQKGILS